MSPQRKARPAPASARRRRPAKKAKPRGRAARRPTIALSGAPVSSGLAPGMQAVNVYLAVANVAASVAFLERAFGFTRGVVLMEEDGQPRYAEMRHGTSVVMLVRKGDAATATGGAAALYTYVSDVDRAAAHAREAGAGVAEAEDRPWGDRAALVTDPDGYRWVLATFKKLAPFGL